MLDKLLLRSSPPRFTRQHVQGIEDTVGVCLSGGGIRSASYCLGVLQALRLRTAEGEEGVLSRAKELTAVSGGAYIAAAHSVSATQVSPPKGPPSEMGGLTGEVAGDLQERPAWSRGSPEELHLRNHSSYIAPNLTQKIRASSIWFRGFVLNLACISLVVLGAGSLVGWALHLIHDGVRDGGVSGLDSAPWFFAAGLTAAGFSIFTFDAIFDVWPRRESAWRKTSSWLLTAGAVVALFAALPYVILFTGNLLGDLDGFINAIRDGLELKADSDAEPVPRDGTDWLLLIQLVAIANAALAAIRFMTAKGRTYYAPIAAAVAGPLVLLIPFLSIVEDASTHGPRPFFEVSWLPLEGLGEGALVAVLLGCVYALLEWRFNCNKTSLHYFYTRRLSTVFALQRAAPGRAAAMPEERPPFLHDFQPGTGWPSFTYCAAANVSGDHSAPPGRDAIPFDFSSGDCGSREAGWLPATILSAMMGDLTTLAAVAISGAAFSPVMGKQTKRPYTFLMALFNLRLGVWVPNPRFVRAKSGVDGDDKDSRRRLEEYASRWSRWAPRPGLRYLMYELLGSHRIGRRYLYVTDGGHYDNLGLVQLLRTGCTTIFCFDASGDRVDTFNTLGEAIALARSELLVDISIDPESLAPMGDGAAVSPYVIGSITYHDGTEGTLVFVKATISAGLPWDIRAFRKADSRFPSHSTMDQLFTDKKFESYRELGYRSAREAIDGLRRRRADMSNDAVRVSVGGSRRRSSSLTDVISDVLEGREAARLDLSSSQIRALQDALSPKVMIGHTSVILTFQQNPGDVTTATAFVDIEVPTDTVEVTTAMSQFALMFQSPADAAIGTWRSDIGYVPEIFESPLESQERRLAFQQVGVAVESFDGGRARIRGYGLLADASASPWAGFVEADVTFWGPLRLVR